MSFVPSNPMSPTKRIRTDVTEDPLDRLLGPKVEKIREDELPLKITVVNHYRFLRSSYTSRLEIVLLFKLLDNLTFTYSSFLLY